MKVIYRTAWLIIMSMLMMVTPAIAGLPSQEMIIVEQFLQPWVIAMDLICCMILLKLVFKLTPRRALLADVAVNLVSIPSLVLLLIVLLITNQRLTWSVTFVLIPIFCTVLEIVVLIRYFKIPIGILRCSGLLASNILVAVVVYLGMIHYSPEYVRNMIMNGVKSPTLRSCASPLARLNAER
jgi:hypothetical protein